MELNIEQIKELIPHRYPFLLVDRITECVPGERASVSVPMSRSFRGISRSLQ